MTRDTDPRPTPNTSDVPGPEPTQTPQQATVLLTMAVPDQVSGVKFDPGAWLSNLTNRMIVADPDKTLCLWAMLVGLQMDGRLIDDGGDHLWSGREGS